MASIDLVADVDDLRPFPDHTQLPETEGNLLLTGDERAAQAAVQLELTEQQLAQERQRTERLMGLLRAQGIDPNLE